MGDVQARTSATLIPFPSSASRAARAPLRDDEPRGDILLFTGVRYERQVEPNPGPFEPLASEGQAKARRRRRR
jgi:hypothetical protein